MVVLFVKIFAIVTLICCVLLYIGYLFVRRQERNEVHDPNREYCTICHKDTGYVRETPIDKRYYHVDGAGQLCEDCWGFLYARKRECAME